MKLDANSIITLALLAACIFFGTMWYLQGSDYKKKLKEADIRIEAIEKVRDSLKIANKKLETDYFDIQKSITDRENKIKSVEKELAIVKKSLDSALLQVSQNQKRLEDSKKRIQKLRDNPIKRDGEDLINSLKEKLKNN